MLNEQFTESIFEPYVTALNTVKNRVVQERSYEESVEPIATIHSISTLLKSYSIEARRQRIRDGHFLAIKHNDEILFARWLMYVIGSVVLGEKKFMIQIQMPDGSQRCITWARKEG
mgnify:CR=1 FL=1